MLKNFRKLIRYPYYYVEPCPVCNSKSTGRIIKDGAANDVQWQISESLKNGELVKVATSNNNNNCFCLNCLFEWKGKIELKWLTSDAIENEKLQRETPALYSELKKMKKEEKANYNKKHPFSSPFKNFVGKL